MNQPVSAAEQTLELVETKEIQMFLPVMKEIDFGDRFLLSMLHWCEIGQRSTPLDYWKVFLLRAEGSVVGKDFCGRDVGWRDPIRLRAKARRYRSPGTLVFQWVC